MRRKMKRLQSMKYRGEIKWKVYEYLQDGMSAQATNLVRLIEKDKPKEIYNYHHKNTNRLVLNAVNELKRTGHVEEIKGRWYKTEVVAKIKDAWYRIG